MPRTGRALRRTVTRPSTCPTNRMLAAWRRLSRRIVVVIQRLSAKQDFASRILGRACPLNRTLHPDLPRCRDLAGTPLSPMKHSMFETSVPFDEAHFTLCTHCF